MKKKMIAIFALLVFALPAIANADPDPRQWHWIGSDDEVGFFVSTQRPQRYGNGVKQWVMQCHGDGNYYVSLWGFLWSNGKFTSLIRTIEYDSEDRVIDTYTYPYIEWEEVAPGTYGEHIWNYVDMQCRRMK